MPRKRPIQKKAKELNPDALGAILWALEQKGSENGAAELLGCEHNSVRYHLDKAGVRPKVVRYVVELEPIEADE